MNNWTLAAACLLTGVMLSGCDGDSLTGFGEPHYDYDFGFGVTSTPFPDGHKHTALFIRCDDLKSGQDISPGLFLISDHDHTLTISVEQQAEITRGNPVVVETMDIHPHNWRFKAGLC